MSGRLQVAKVKAIRESGPWTLLHDGASGSKGENMINFVASSLQRIIHLATLDAQWAAKCASRAAAWLEQELQAYGLNNFAAVVMDGAAVMRAAWALPRVDPDLQERRLVFMVRGAHGQLARGGRRRALPLGSQGALNMFPLGSSGFVCCFPWVRLLFPLGSSVVSLGFVRCSPAWAWSSPSFASGRCCARIGRISIIVIKSNAITAQNAL